ncbi:MAG: hypothetical protein L6437_01555 [Kiritimatiellae bacterium]|nr:hypothetical protein [Kiritimatiellia bacterium]
MNALLLTVGVAGATGFWIVNRWAARSGARTEIYIFYLLLVSALLSGLLALLLGQSLIRPFLWEFGGVTGLAYVASLGLLMYGLKIGPTGPTVAVNNMGLLWPVVISIVWLKPRVPSFQLCAGMMAVCAAVILLSLIPGNAPASQGADHANGRVTSRRWSLTMLFLWVAAGVSMGAQAVGSTHLADAPLAMCFSFNIVALLIVAPFFFRQRSIQIRRCEVLPGLVQGLVQVITAAAIFMAIPHIGAEVVFPFVVASPIILMLLIGRFVHGEHITYSAWIGCLLGAAGLVLLVVF